MWGEEGHFSGTLKDKLLVTGGCGGMGGAQPLAATMAEACCLIADVELSRLQKRIDTRYLDVIAPSIDAALEKAEGPCATRTPRRATGERGGRQRSGGCCGEIDSRDFSAPVSGFDISRLRIGSASVDLGRVVLRNKWLLKTLEQLAGSSLAGETSAWFTPLRFSMQDGVVRYERRMEPWKAMSKGAGRPGR